MLQIPTMLNSSNELKISDGMQFDIYYSDLHISILYFPLHSDKMYLLLKATFNKSLFFKQL